MAAVNSQSAEALSRLPTFRTNNTKLVDQIPVMVVARMKLQADMKKSVVPNRTQEKRLLTENPDKYGAGLYSLYEFIIAQCKDYFLEQSRQLAATPGCAFTIDKTEFLARKTIPIGQYRSSHPHH